MTFRKIAFFCALTSAAVITPSLPAISGQACLACERMRTSEIEKLSVLSEDFFLRLQEVLPEMATYVGSLEGYDGLWTDHTEAGYASRMKIIQQTLEALHRINRKALPPSEMLNYDLLETDLLTSLEAWPFQTQYMPMDQLGGIPQDVEGVLAMMPRANEEDYENILSRLEGVKALVEQTIVLMEKGVEKNLTPPQVVLRKLPLIIEKMIPPAKENSIFFQPFASFPQPINENKAQEYTRRALEIIDEQIYPAYKRLYDFLKFTYIPSCRQSVAASDLPNGAEFYKYCVKRHTTTNLSPQEIHAIGLREVDRIEREMHKIIEDLDFDGSIIEYFDHLNSAPEFFYTQPEDLINGYKAITGFIDGQLQLLFGRFPVLPYEVVPVPEFAQESQVGAYYMRGSLASGRPGRFFANTYDLKSRPKWQMETLALHEAVPGHHFQISIAQEIEGMPEFRKYNSYTAYIEGWGLYSESLGKELGLYKDPVNQFGRLIEEMWRAVRLVVDTGIHALGWSREQAISFMQAKTGINEREVTTEIDRYIVWPGQALAYKIGELSIQRWRREATEILGDKFDIRAFHDMLLSQGALPLDICEKHVHAWIASQL